MDGEVLQTAASDLEPRSRSVAVHLRAESGPNRSAFALSSRARGGDVLWLAYVPDGLRNWFSRFADTIDPDRSHRRPDRVARFFHAPRPDEIETLLALARSSEASAEGSQSAAQLSPEADRLAFEIAAGRLHVTTVVLDVHHLPTLTRVLRSDGIAFAARHHLKNPAADWLARYVVLRLRRLIQQLRAANLRVVIATPRTTRAERLGPLAREGFDAVVLEAIDAEVALALSLPDAVSAADARRQPRVETSRLPDLPPGRELSGWAEIWNAPLGPESWIERLERACPRVERLSGLDGGARDDAWSDDTQEQFIRWAEARGWSVERATPEQDRREHWDAAIVRPGERYRVDVKARGRLRRGDAAPQDRWHWIELRGVVDAGWLFGGQADLIAFQTPSSFLLVPRLDLREHVLHHVDPFEVVSRPPDAVYRVYHRRDREEAASRATGSDRGVLTLIPTGRLHLIAWDDRREPENVHPARKKLRPSKKGRSRGISGVADVANGSA